MKLSLIAPFSLLAACSGSAPQNPQIDGVWKPLSGTTTLTCKAAATTQVLPASNSDHWVDGSDGTVTLTNEFGTLRATATVDTASWQKGSSVPASDLWLEYFPGSGPVDPTTGQPEGTIGGQVELRQYRFAIDTEGRATETYQGTASLMIDGKLTACDLSETGSYMKISN